MRRRASGRHIHDLIAQAKERGTIKRLSEEVGEVIRGADERHANLVILNGFAHKEVPPLHMLHAGVVLGVVSDVDRSGVVHEQVDGLGVRETQLARKGAEVDGLLGRLRGSHDLGLTG